MGERYLWQGAATSTGAAEEAAALFRHPLQPRCMQLASAHDCAELPGRCMVVIAQSRRRQSRRRRVTGTGRQATNAEAPHLLRPSPLLAPTLAMSGTEVSFSLEDGNL